MIDITMREGIYPTQPYNGAIICLTPKIPGSQVIENGHIKYEECCKFINNIADLYYYYGNPDIDPKKYSDLYLVRMIIQLGIGVYIMPVFHSFYVENLHYNYNGFTDDSILENGSSLSFRTQSPYCMCRCVLSSYVKENILNVVIHTYKVSNTNKPFDESLKIDELTVVLMEYNTDKDLEDSLLEYGIYLKCFTNESQSLVKTLFSLGSYDSRVSEFISLNPYLYFYDFDTNIAYNHYCYLIQELSLLPLTLDYICLGHLHQSSEHIPGDLNSLNQLSPSFIRMVHSCLQRLFDENSGTYLYINSPDLSCVENTNWINSKGKFSGLSPIIYSYNTELFYNSIVNRNIINIYTRDRTDVDYLTSVLVFINVLYLSNNNEAIYYAGEFSNAITFDNSIKNSLSRYMADQLVDSHCNTLVNFERTLPWLYGNKTLSNEISLSKAHIARTVVALSKSVKEYLTTLQFSLVTFGFSETIKYYIDYNFINNRLYSGLIRESSIEVSIVNNKVIVNIILYFYDVLKEIKLDFTVNLYS